MIRGICSNVHKNNEKHEVSGNESQQVRDGRTKNCSIRRNLQFLLYQKKIMAAVFERTPTTQTIEATMNAVKNSSVCPLDEVIVFLSVILTNVSLVVENFTLHSM